MQVENGFNEICRTQVRKHCQTLLQLDLALCRWTLHYAGGLCIMQVQN